VIFELYRKDLQPRKKTPEGNRRIPVVIK